MTTVAPTNSSTTSNTTSTSSANATISSDFTTFLTLMTTQLKYQDPLEPIESSDYAVQLATFSQVEQQTKSNQLLESIAGSIGVTGLAQYASWVGMEVSAKTAGSYDGSTPMSLSVSPSSEADQALLVVRNSLGKEVSRQEVALSATKAAWDGTNTAGVAQTAGTYTFELQNYSEGKLISTDNLATYNTVLEARSGSAGVTLVLSNGKEISTDDVTSLRSVN